MSGTACMSSAVPRAGRTSSSIGASSATGAGAGIDGSVVAPAVAKSDSDCMVELLQDRVKGLETHLSALWEENDEKDREIEYLRRLVEESRRAQLTPVPPREHQSTDSRSTKYNTSISTSRVDRSLYAASRPMHSYQTCDGRDLVDVRLSEFYNSTGSKVPFQRINKGFYKFGRTVVDLEIVNHKLMAKTDDGWNRGKWAPIEKFLSAYEYIERDRCGIPMVD